MRRQKEEENGEKTTNNLVKTELKMMIERRSFA